MALSLPQPSPAAARHPQALRRWRTGQEHARLEQWPQAARAYEHATQLHDDPAYVLAAAHALIKAGRSADSVTLARRLRARRPDTVLAYTLESHALLELGRASEAIDCLAAMPADAPRDRVFETSMAIALQNCGRHREAIPRFLAALAHKIDDAAAHFQLGVSFRGVEMKSEAAECMRTAVVLGLGASDLAARSLLAFLEREACRWPQAAEVLDALRGAVRAAAPEAAIETGPFPYAVLVGDPLEQHKAARHYALHLQRRARPLPRRAARAHEGRLRVGYLSSDFHQHATSQLMAQMLESHDRARFDITLFSTGPDDGSALRRRVVASCERFVELRGVGLDDVAARVRDAGIDILVDLKGATFDTPFAAMACRAAPLQVSWLGFPGTSGAPFIDYIVGDPVVTPLAHATHFSEKIAQLPLCYQPNDAQRPLPRTSTRAEWGVADDAFVMCAFHQSYKISPEVFDAWCTLLHARADAVLWLLQWNTNVQAALEREAAARGIDPARLVFAPLAAPAEHLSRLAHADVYLDAWPCNAHTTASEALWVGVPVVTLQGETFAQRVAASLLHAVGLGDELVCHDVEAYRDTVLALAGDAARRERLREHLLQQRAASPLFDGARFARDIEALYLRMWERAIRGLPPEHLPAGTSATPALASR